MKLPPEIMQWLLGAVARSPKPHKDEIDEALVQLAEAAAAIIKHRGAGAREKFEYQLAMALERSHAQPGDEE
jgi:hypothetical protein